MAKNRMSHTSAFQKARLATYWAGMCMLMLLSIALLTACAGREAATVETTSASFENGDAPSEAELTQLLMNELERLGIDPTAQQASILAEDNVAKSNQAVLGYGFRSTRGLAFVVDSLQFAGWTDDPDGPSGAAAPATGVLQWVEELTGDYDQNGEVGMQDITPIAQYWGQKVEYIEIAENGETQRIPTGDPLGDGSLNWRLARVDGNKDGEIGFQDIVPLAQNFGMRIAGYRIFWLVPNEEGTIHYIDTISNRPAVNASTPVVYTYKLDYSTAQQALFLTDEGLVQPGGRYYIPPNETPPGRYFVRALAHGPEPYAVADSNIAEVRYEAPAVASEFRRYWSRPYTHYLIDTNKPTNHPEAYYYCYSYCPYDLNWYRELSLIHASPNQDGQWAKTLDVHYGASFNIAHPVLTNDGNLITAFVDNNGSSFPYHSIATICEIRENGEFAWQIAQGLKYEYPYCAVDTYYYSSPCLAVSEDEVVALSSLYAMGVWFLSDYLLLWQTYDRTGMNQLTRAFAMDLEHPFFPCPQALMHRSDGSYLAIGEAMLQADIDDETYIFPSPYFAMHISADGEILHTQAVGFADDYILLDAKLSRADDIYLLLTPRVFPYENSFTLMKFTANCEFAWAVSCTDLLMDDQYNEVQLGFTRDGRPVVCGNRFVEGILDYLDWFSRRPAAIIFDSTGAVSSAYMQRFDDPTNPFQTKTGTFLGIGNDPLTGELEIYSTKYRQTDASFLSWELFPASSTKLEPEQYYSPTWDERDYWLPNDTPGEYDLVDIPDYFTDHYEKQCWSMPLPLGNEM